MFDDSLDDELTVKLKMYVEMTNWDSMKETLDEIEEGTHDGLTRGEIETGYGYIGQQIGQTGEVHQVTDTRITGQQGAWEEKIGKTNFKNWTEAGFLEQIGAVDESTGAQNYVLNYSALERAQAKGIDDDGIMTAIQEIMDKYAFLGGSGGTTLGSGSYANLALTDYLKKLEPIKKEIEKIDKEIKNLEEDWQRVGYQTENYGDTLNDVLANMDVKNFNWNNFIDNAGLDELFGENGLYGREKTKYEQGITEAQQYQKDLIAEMQANLVLRDKAGNIIDTDMVENSGFDFAQIGNLAHQQKVLDYFTKQEKLITQSKNEISQRQDKDSEGNFKFASKEDEKAYNALEEQLSSISQLKQVFSEGFSQYTGLEDFILNSQQNIDGIIQQEVDTRLATADAMFELDQGWNTIAQAENDLQESLYAEDNYSKLVTAERVKNRKTNVAILEDTLGDIRERQNYLNAMPDWVKDTKAWQQAMNNALIEEANTQAEIYTMERENVQSYVDDIVGYYEERNSKIENLQTAYDNILSATEEFTLFDKDGKISANFARRAKALAGGVSVAQSRLSNAQNEYQGLAKQYAEEMAANKKRLEQGKELVDLTNLETALREAQGKILSEEAALVEAVTAAYDELTATLEKYNEEIERQTEKLEAIIEISDTYISILETIGERFDIGDVLQPEAMQKMQRASLDIALKNVKAIREQRDVQKYVLDQIDAQLAKTKKGSAQYNNLLAIRNEEASKLIELETELGSTMSDSITKAAESYEQNVDRIMETMKDAMAGLNYGSLDDLQTAYDRAEETAGRFLDITKQEYELSKLRRNINQQINANTTEAANIKYRDILEDINKIEKDNLRMSEYDLKMLNAKYELYKAQIALEEAQNNKSQMRLQRNASGNWSYVFTADQNKIDQATQKVEDAQYSIYSQSEQYLKETEKNVITLQQEWTAALDEIYKDATLSEEERIKKINETNEYYASKLSYFSTEMDKTLEVTGIKFEETTYSMITGYKSFDEVQKATTDAVIAGLTDMEEELVTLEQDTDTAMENAGLDLNTFGDTVSELAGDGENSIVKNFDTIASSIGTACTSITQALTPVLTLLNQLKGLDIGSSLPKIEEFNSEEEQKVINDAEKLSEETEDYAGLMIETAKKKNAGNELVTLNQKRNAKINKEGLGYVKYSDEEILAAYNDGIFNTAIDFGKKVYDENTDYMALMNEDKQKYQNEKDKKVQERILTNILKANKNRNYKITTENLDTKRYTDEEITSWVKNEKKIEELKGFNTGGYTGVWGSEGKLAILHEKELVLNKKDTQNILNAVEIARMLAGNAYGQMYNLANAFSLAKIQSVMAPQQLEQNVHIEATFPGVQSAFEIETALKNIVNDVSQYAEIPKE